MKYWKNGRYMRRTEAAGSMENGYSRILIISAVPVMEDPEVNITILCIIKIAERIGVAGYTIP